MEDHKMGSKNEELIFDFMAAAEDTGKRLDALIITIPGSLQKILSAEYQRSPWLTAIPAEVERLSTVVQRADSAAERTESVATQTVSKIKTVCRVACLSAIIMPLVTLGIVVWILSDLRGQQVQLEQRNAELANAIATAAQTATRLAEEITRQRGEIEKLSATADLLKHETGGLDVVDNGDGAWEIILPPGASLERRAGRNFDGRLVVSYVISGE
jgi:uncharacterized coiled-coil protein SlyX